jgi:hypothetical protein
MKYFLTPLYSGFPSRPEILGRLEFAMTPKLESEEVIGKCFVARAPLSVDHLQSIVRYLRLVVLRTG